MLLTFRVVHPYGNADNTTSTYILVPGSTLFRKTAILFQRTGRPKLTTFSVEISLFMEATVCLGARHLLFSLLPRE